MSGLLVILSLASPLIFPEVFLRSMALGGMAAVLVPMFLLSQIRRRGRYSSVS